jgi:DNA-binding Lrp family transcriptional regulator
MPSRKTGLDRHDLRLLDELERDAWSTYAALSRRVHLSASAVQRRIERLIADGVLLGAHARIAPQALGRGLRLIVLVELTRDTERVVQSFVRSVAPWRELESADYVAGSADIVLRVEAASMESYAQAAERLLGRNPAVRRYQTLTVLRPLR